MKKRLLFYVMILVVVALGSTLVATAQDQVDGNPKCADYGLLEYKLEPPSAGWHEIHAGDLSELEDPAWLNIMVADDELSLDWSANFGVDLVIAKGGNEGANLYWYKPEAMGGTDLQVPTGQQLSHISVCYDVNPAVEIEKHTNDIDADAPTGPEVAIGSTVIWTYWVTNTGDVPLYFSVTDNQGVDVTCDADVVEVGQTVRCIASGSAIEGQYANLGTVDASYGLTDTDPSHYFGTDAPPPPPPPGDGTQGCTPGYWRQTHHFDDWNGFAPDESASALLGRDVGSLTLGDAVAVGGGGLNALLRHTVAALLNASNPDVDYPYSTDEILAMFQEAYDSGDYEATKDLFDVANNLGCPLGNSNDSNTGDDGDMGDDGETQVTICHIPPGNPDNPITITVGESAVEAHLAHGDTLGECPATE